MRGSPPIETVSEDHPLDDEGGIASWDRRGSGLPPVPLSL
jgi:hypothetical protein